MRHAVALHVQAEYCPYTPLCGTQGEPNEYYTEFDMLVLDGDPRHPWNTDSPWEGDTEDDIRNYYSGERFGRGYRYFTGRRSVSMSLGFHMNGTKGCEPELHEKVNIGIHCAWTVDEKREPSLAGKPCKFSIRVNLIPETVYDGYEADLPIAPAGELGFDNHVPVYMQDEDYEYDGQMDAAAAYFRLSVGGFDIVNVSVERTGTNTSVVTQSGEVVTNGQGLVGLFLRQRAEVSCPSLHSFDKGTNLTLSSVTEALVDFCTVPSDTAEYIFGVLAGMVFGPFPEDDDPGYVGPDGMPLDPGDSRRAFKEQTSYGRYTLRVRHEPYFDGEVSAGGSRPICLSYGQWRSFHIDTTGVSDAIIEVSVSEPTSGIYLRADAPATLTPSLLYDVRSPPRALLATASPCDVTVVTRWHFSIYMASMGEVSADSTSPPIVPTRLTLAVMLRDAALQPGQLVLPSSEGGRGYTCCGAARLFRLSAIPEAAALRASVNVTRGRVHALSAKWGSCVTPADVDATRGACEGFCTMAWLTQVGAYSGTLYSQSALTLTVPHGHANAPDKRRAGAWYVSVHAMEGEDAEFLLTSELTYPVYIPPDSRCSRTTFACANDSARAAWSQGGYPAPPPSVMALAWLQASGGRNGVLADASSLASAGIQSRAVPAGVLFILSILACWLFRTWRQRRRARYRVPHDYDG